MQRDEEKEDDLSRKSSSDTAFASAHLSLSLDSLSRELLSLDAVEIEIECKRRRDEIEERKKIRTDEQQVVVGPVGTGKC